MNVGSRGRAGWAAAKIGDLVGCHGVFCDGDWVESEDQDPDGDVRLIQLADVGDGEFRNRSSRFMTSSKAKELRCTYLVSGDVLVARMPDPLGRACIFPGDGKPCVTVVDVCILRPIGAATMPRWLMWFINAPQFREAVHRLQSGSTRKRISRKNLGTLLLPVPPPDEQRRIAAKIEELFSELDAGVAALRRVQANLKRYRAAVLNAAVTGKLTEAWRKQNPPTEPADKLLARILDERRKKWEEDQLRRFEADGQNPPKSWRSRYKAPADHEQETLPIIPSSWTWVSLGALAWSVRDGPHYSPKYADNGVPFITGGQVRPEGIDFERAKFITKDLHRELCRRCKPEYGDLLYTKGGTTGIAHINRDKREFSVWVHVAVLKLVDHCDRRYLQHALNSPFCYAQSQHYTHGVGNQDLGLTRMVKIALPLPPLDEQTAIADEVERRISTLNVVENEVCGNLLKAKRLRQSVLKRAFDGHLLVSGVETASESLMVTSLDMESEPASTT